MVTSESIARVNASLQSHKNRVGRHLSLLLPSLISGSFHSEPDRAITFHNRCVEDYQPSQGTADQQQQHRQTNFCNSPTSLSRFTWFLHDIHLAFGFAHIPPDCRLCGKDTIGVWDGPGRELPVCVFMCVWAVQWSIGKLCQLTCSEWASTAEHLQQLHWQELWNCWSRCMKTVCHSTCSFFFK